MQEIKAGPQKTCKISCSFKVRYRFFEPHCMDKEQDLRVGINACSEKIGQDLE